MLKVRGSQDFMNKLKKDKVKLLNKTAETHRRIVKHIFTDIVTFTPQWSGNTASNWYIMFKGVPASYHELPGYKPPYMWEPGDTEPYQLGSDPVVSETIARELVKLPRIRWNTKVTIVNKTPYAEDLENNIGPMGEFDYEPREIREVNLHPNYGKVAMVAYVSVKYNNLRTLKRLAI
jgi:hypothetical protein